MTKTRDRHQNRTERTDAVDPDTRKHQQADNDKEVVTNAGQDIDSTDDILVIDGENFGRDHQADADEASDQVEKAGSDVERGTPGRTSSGDGSNGQKYTSGKMTGHKNT